MKNKVGRNDKCPCESGKKYKHCCLRTTAFSAETAPSTSEELQIQRRMDDRHYILDADLGIGVDNVVIEGLHVKGNINLSNAKNIKFKRNIIESKEDHKMNGNINVGDGNEFFIEETIVTGDINIGSKNKFKLKKNYVGFSVKDEKIVIDGLNVLLKKDSSKNDIIDSAKLIEGKMQIASAPFDEIGRFLTSEDKKINGKLSRRINETLKKIGVTTVEKAVGIGIGMFFTWLSNLF